MFKIIIFDFDGTIADTIPTMTKILLDLSEKYKYRKLSKKEINILRDFTIPKIFQQMHV